PGRERVHPLACRGRPAPCAGRSQKADALEADLRRIVRAVSGHEISRPETFLHRRQRDGDCGGRSVDRERRAPRDHRHYHRHGDAAFAGEGVVAETLNLSQLPGYRTRGTIHLITNNQVGFTTPPEEGRSSTYSTDIAKMIQVPIFHINSDDVEAAYNVLQIALDYRQTFNKDVVLDIIGYRKLGHNEGDEPTYTQPLMYQRIKEHPGARELYARRLIAEGVM